MTGGGPTLARTLMVQGTASHVGKSWLVAGLCRLLRQDGWRVAPFKSQNMALNAAVVPGGGEIGRAQALQAQAAGIPPSVDLNPVLLKPTGELSSQVILRGAPVGVYRAHDYYAQLRERAWAEIRGSLERLRRGHEVVVIEGAGSPAEVNLRHRDIANMRVAALAEAPVLLVADIDRGGAFAALVGTLELLEPEERARVGGLVLNRFRGDPSLLGDGPAHLARRTGVPVLGVVPWLDLRLDEEDGVALDETPPPAGPADVEVAVVRLPRISNFTDFDALARAPGVRLRFCRRPGEAAHADALILPGSRSTAADLAWLRREGWEAPVRRAPMTIGLCAGLQLLGRELRDPQGVEGEPGESVAGLGLLDAVTTYRRGKRAVESRATVRPGAPGFLAGLAGEALDGYEIHHGETALGPGSVAFLDGCGSAASPDGRVVATYLHGFFDNRAVLAAFVGALRARRGLPPLPDGAYRHAGDAREAALDELAAALRRHLDIAAVYRLAGLDRA